MARVVPVRVDEVKFAYADPVYLGQSKHYPEHPDAADYDDPETHHDLIDRLIWDFPDGWALSCSTPSLRVLLPMCPEDVRLMAWTKTFASFKPGVNPAYAWEPILVRGGRKRGRDVPTVRDWVSCPITLMRGVKGAKPEAFCRWLFEVLGMKPTDEFHDLFPGSGAVTAAWEAWRSQTILAPPRTVAAPFADGLPLIPDHAV